jgi:hypothetical protein
MNNQHWRGKMGLRLFVWMALLLLCLAAGAAAQGGFDVGIPSLKAGRVDTAQPAAMPDLPGYEGFAALNRHYADVIGGLEAEASMAIDPAHVEQLQKEIQDLKAEQEKALMELQLEIAYQNGDEDRALRLEQALQHFYRSAQLLPDPSEPTQRPEQTATRNRVKNPDDE